MAPTEVLARQHFQAMEKLLQEQNIDFGHPVLLTGSDTAKGEKGKKYALIASKKRLNLVIGTHALIQEKCSTIILDWLLQMSSIVLV